MALLAYFFHLSLQRQRPGPIGSAATTCLLLSSLAVLVADDLGAGLSHHRDPEPLRLGERMRGVLRGEDLRRSLLAVDEDLDQPNGEF